MKFFAFVFLWQKKDFSEWTHKLNYNTYKHYYKRKMNLKEILIVLLLFVTYSNASFAKKGFSTDSLFVKLEKQSDDTQKVNVFLRLSERNLSNNPEKSFAYANQALDLAKKLNYKKGIAASYNDLGIHFFYKGDFNEALDYYFNSMKIREDLNDKPALATIYNNIGASYNSLSNYTNALEYYLKALKIEEETNNKSGMARCYNNIGIIYYVNENYVKTLDYFIKSAKIKEELADSSGLASSYNNIGELFRQQKNFSRSLEFFNKSLKIAEDLKDLRSIAQATLNMGLTYRDLGNNKLAREYFNKSLNIKSDINDMHGFGLALINIAATYKEEKDYKRAEIEYKKAVDVAKYLNSYDFLKDIYIDLSDIYEINGDLNKSLLYFKLYSASKDSIIKLQSSEKFAELQTQFESEQKEKEISLLKNEKKLQDLELRRQKIILYFFIAGFIFIVLISFLFLREYRNKRKANRLLSAQTSKILDQSVKLELANLKLEKLSIVAKETSNAVVIFDKSGKIEWINDGFSHIYGYSLDEIINKAKSSHIIELSNNKNIKAYVDESLKKKSSVNYDTLASTKFNKKIWIKTTLTPIYDEVGNLRKFIAVDTDISAIKNAEEEISRKNRNITDSINYAKKIQDAILINEDDFINNLPGSFVYYSPKDIVSGDFYWINNINDKIIVVAADCTGHGVPGALMSMIGVMLLNEIVNQKHIMKPSVILEKLHNGILDVLHQESNDNASQDGMDIAICIIDKNESILEYSGAMMSMYVLNNDKIEIIDADLRSLGGSMWLRKETDNYKYSNHIVELSEGMMIYLFSDGYLDQFGGDENRKFNGAQFRELLLSINKLPAEEQKTIVSNTIEQWRGDNKQLDDMLILGIKI
ncbi:MAG: hypothetical protein A2046_12755 [Bacteroidetes bacterium GWA2_30_7]|nr:MAG: hypothetical protein A2046_12755 [Bacteroidetes bacterium GWA2_30_7]